MKIRDTLMLRLFSYLLFSVSMRDILFLPDVLEKPGGWGSKIQIPSYVGYPPHPNKDIFPVEYSVRVKMIRAR